MFNIYREDQFPEGVLRTEKGRKVFLSNAFRDVFREQTGKDLTQEICNNECRQVENTHESTYDRLPCLAMYHHDLPLVRLYFRGGQYELHTLANKVSMPEIVMIVSCDELNHDLVKKEDAEK